MSTKAAVATMVGKGIDFRNLKRGGIFAGVSAAKYHGDPLPSASVNASTLHDLDAQSPRHAWVNHPRLNPAWSAGKSTSEQDFGSAAHSALMGAGKVEVVDAQNWQTDIAKSLRARARKNDATPILKRDWLRIQQMVTVLRQDLRSVDSPIPDVFDPKYGGVPEVMAAWQQDGIWCRARADWWIGAKQKAMFAPNGIIVDYKTTGISCAEYAWIANAYRIGAPYQAVWYPHGFFEALKQSESATTLNAPPRFLFIVQETFEPFAHNVFELSDVAITQAEGDVVGAFNRWHACITTGEWPKYPRRVCQVDPPAWKVRDSEMRRIVGDTMNKPL